MGDIELSKALKDLPYRVQTASLKGRKEVVENVINVLSNPGVSIQVVRGICKVIQLTLPRYRDSASQQLVRNLILALIERHPENAIKGLCGILLDIAKLHKNLVVTSNTCQTGLYALHWSCILLTNGWKHDEKVILEYIPQIVEIQSVLYSNVEAGSNVKRSTKAFNLINAALEKVPDSEKLYLETMKKLEQTPSVVVFAAAIAKRLSLIKNTTLFEAYVEGVLDSYIKNFISCKTKPSIELISACGPIFFSITEEHFKKSLLPAIQKAMLRSPEILLGCMPMIIKNSSVKLDLSPHAMGIGESLIANLYSKNDQARDDAANSLQALALGITQANSIESLIKKIFSVLDGSQGKLTVVDHKIGVLEGAGKLSICHTNLDKDSVQVLIPKVIDYFIKVLSIEVAEKTTCHCLEMLSLWTSKLENDIPKKLIDATKTGMTAKTATPLVRTTYLKLMLRSKFVPSKELIPVILKSVENAVNQSSQAQSVTEGLCAVCVLLNVVSLNSDKENGFHNMWHAVLDMDKQVFVSEKFLSSATADGLVLVMELCEKLLLNYPDKLGGKTSPLYKAVIFCVTSGTSQVRRICFPILKSMVNDDNRGSSLSRALFHEFTVFLDSAAVKNTLERRLKDQTDSTDISPHALVECISTLCSSTKLSVEHKELLALDALLPCHHPVVTSAAPGLWLKVVKHLGIQPKELVNKYNIQFKNDLIENYHTSSAKQYALASIVQISPEKILPPLIETVINQLQDARICQISKEDYFTFLTPEGELFDKSVIPGDDSNKEMNMKRESKVYSYKEQLEELQLRRELEEKKRKAGKIQAPKYTQKQIEAINNQKAKEQAVRTRLSELNTIIINSVSMIKAAAMGNPVEVSLYLKDLLPVLIKDLQSPLAAPYLSKLFTDLRCVVFPNNDTSGEVIAFITLRLLKPQCDLDANWEEEDLNKAMLRTMNLIYEKTVKRKNEEKKPTLLSAPAFCYTFPFLKSSFLSDYAKKHEDFLLTGVHIIAEHSKLRGGLAETFITDYSMPRDTSNGSLSKNRLGSKDIYHPRYLPSEQMFELLIHVINQTSGRIQTQAEACLLDVAKCLSGKMDCAEASKAEIDVLLEALQRPEGVVRDAALRALTIIIDCLPTFKTDSEYALKLNKRIWIAKYDEMKENCVLADELWKLGEMSFPTELSDELLIDIENCVKPVQAAAAKALAELLGMNRNQVQSTLDALLKLYQNKLELIPPILDEFGREVEPAIDTWQPRRGVALAINEIAPLITPEQIGDIIEFFVNSSLRDRNETVRTEMLNAALKLVDLHGKETVGTLWPVFDKFMGTSSKSAHFDAVKQAVVILMGSLARHLDEDDPRIKPIVMRLIQALSTPSQTVQEAVAKCLPHLCASVKDEAPGLVNKLLHQLLKGDKYGERKGAAYGLAGMIKGMGILALKQQDLMAKLTDAIQDKKNYKFREGALFAFEMLFQMLGKLFEPYIVHVLPHLLQCFGDTSQHVRTAADDTAKVIMSKLSGHGVKLILPSLLDALNEDSWRTKTGSVELLGAMAYCAPKQLSSCLPSIVPKLIEVLSDSHMKVQEAGADALKVIGSVIRNPEIQAIVPVLLKALQDPSNKTSACLQTLLDTQFVHFIDAPSLALIMPVVQRAFIDRSTETRKMAAQIIGNMYSLTDQKDLLPYLPNIIPGLKNSLLDPVPEVRSVSARALGAMVRGMGESSFEDLLPWLMQTLTSESSSVDRSGAAQGLSEVVGGLGVEKLHKLMPEIISTAERSDIAPHVKDGYIMMFIYMPVVFTNEFTPYIGQIITPILKALADENEYVRDTALKAGQRIVTLYADSAILLLLPELEKGLFDENWRIRYSSVQLLGDLLYRISGVTGKMSTETASEDDNFGTEQSHYAIINSLGEERRNRVLAGLYMGRSDVALMVRQAALHVWKVVVTNTPRTLREILPTLFGLLLGCLASDSYDKRQVAARTLGDLVRKLGERVLPEIIPILERGLQSDRPDQRQGVCIGLSEIMSSTSKDMVLTFVNSLVPTVRKALCDPLPEVRQAAARTFDSLHSTVGAKALDDILPAMLNQLNDEDPNTVERTLDGLRQVMAIKSRVVLPYLVPQLTAPPTNTKALSILASVAGESLNKYLPRILPALQVALSSSRGTPEEAQQLEYCTALVLSIGDESGVRIVIDTMLENIKNDDANQRRAAATLLCAFCANSKASYVTHVPQLLRGLILLCTDSDAEVLKMAFEALNAITKNLDSKQLPTYVQDVRQAVRYAMSDLKGTSDVLPGFCLAKGISPILPIFREAILNGDNDEKELATLTLGEVIKVTSSKALQQNVIAITGPLIRILGDRFTPNIKMAVLETLSVLLDKVGILMKQFLPQLQTTFVKSLNDPSRVVRMKAANALGCLIKIHLRPDPVFTEIHHLVMRTDDSAIRETALYALRGVISSGGDKMADPIKKQMLDTLRQLDHHWKQDNVCRECAAGCLGVLCQWLNPDDLNQIMTEEILCDKDSPFEQHTAALVLSVIIKESAGKVWETYQRYITAHLLYSLSQESQILKVAIRTCGYLFKYLLQNNLTLPQNLLSTLVRLLGPKQIQETFRYDTSDGLPFPIFPLLPILLEDIVDGDYDEKELAILTLSEIIKATSNKEVLDNIVSITSPFLRILSYQRKPYIQTSKVKIAILETLSLLMTKVSKLMMVFAPYLESAFVDILEKHPSKEVRFTAANALGCVVKIPPRLGSVFLALHTLVIKTYDSEIRETALYALRSVISNGGDKMENLIKGNLLYTLRQVDHSWRQEDVCREYAASCLGAMCRWIKRDDLEQLLTQEILCEERASPFDQHTAALVLFVIIKESARRIWLMFQDNIAAKLLYCLSHKESQVVKVAIRTCGYLFKFLLKHNRALPEKLLSTLAMNLDSKQLPIHVQDVSQAVNYDMWDLKDTSDTLQSLISPIIPILREAFLDGDNDDKEIAILTLCEIIKITTSGALTQNVIVITGPLIRILGDRYTPNIKMAVLEMLSVLLDKAGILMETFVPKLESTILQILKEDPSREVRLRAANTSSNLIKIHLRPDSLFAEIYSVIMRAYDSSIGETALHALREVISNGGDKMVDFIRQQMLKTLRRLDHYWRRDNVCRVCAAGCLGALCQWLNPDDLNQILTQEILCENRDSPLDQHTAALVLSVIIKESPGKVWEKYQSPITAQLLYCLSQESQILRVAIRTCGYLFKYLLQNNLALPQDLLSTLVRIINSAANEAKQHFAKVCILLAKNVPTETWTDDLVKYVLSTLVNGTKDNCRHVKTNFERALVAILKLRDEGVDVQTKCLEILDEGARKSLNNLVVKVLKKVALQPERKDEELDETVVT